MTEGAFKKRLAMLMLNMAGDYLSEADAKLLRKVKRIGEDRAVNWGATVRFGLPPRFWCVEVSTWSSLKRLGHYEPIIANFAATGEKDAAECARFAVLASTIAKLVAALQAIVDENNAEQEKQTETKK